MTSIAHLARRALERGEGIFRLAPTWVPRAFLVPGGRLKLAGNDLYALGRHRGGIDERWLASTISADNPGAPPDEGLSYVVDGAERFTLRDAIAELGAELIGQPLWTEFGGWPVFAKFFDNAGPIPLHLHQDDRLAALVGRQGKPEAYYFPPQLNHTLHSAPFSYFGLRHGTSRQDIRRCLERWDAGDNGILRHSIRYPLEVGTGWLIGPRILHAPGSLVTFEPQWASDVFAMFQSQVDGRPVAWELLVKDVPPDRRHDLDFLLDMIDWDANTDPDFAAKHRLSPVTVAGDVKDGWVDRDIVYGEIDGRPRFGARELTLQPGVKITLCDRGACGLIVMQGRGRIGHHEMICPSVIQFGELTHDEFFVCAGRARDGVVVENLSADVPLITLRYFGPDAHTA